MRKDTEEMAVQSFVLVELFHDHQPAHIENQLERFLCIAPECRKKIHNRSRVVLVQDKQLRYRLVCHSPQCLEGATGEKFEPQAVEVEVIRDLLGLPQKPLSFEQLPLPIQQLARRRSYRQRVQPEGKSEYVDRHVKMLRSH